jgi:glycosyltransferase involved in cell wall biosynthesis
MNNCDILLFVNDLNFYRSHRSKLFTHLSSTKNIIVVTENPSNIDKSDLEGANLKIDLIKFNRSSINPIKNLLYLITLFKKVRKYHPKKIIFVSNKLIFLGALINLFSRKKTAKYFFFFSGLGYLFISNSPIAKFLKYLLLNLIKISSYRKNVEIVVQNNDDLLFFESILNLSHMPIHLIKGNGIQSQKLLNKEVDNINILFAGRLLKDKGIFEYLDAAQFIKHQYPSRNINFLLAGDCDFANPNCISVQELEKIKLDKNIKFFGKLSYANLCKLYAEGHIFVLPSYREGLPRVALEAGSYGMALLLSDVPGCRECVIDDFNGYLFSLTNQEDLIAKIIFLIENPDHLKFMCNNSPPFIDKYFSEQIIFSQFHEVLS